MRRPPTALASADPLLCVSSDGRRLSAARRPMDGEQSGKAFFSWFIQYSHVASLIMVGLTRRARIGEDEGNLHTEGPEKPLNPYAPHNCENRVSSSSDTLRADDPKLT